MPVLKLSAALPPGRRSPPYWPDQRVCGRRHFTWSGENFVNLNSFFFSTTAEYTWSAFCNENAVPSITSVADGLLSVANNEVRMPRRNSVWIWSLSSKRTLLFFASVNGRTEREWERSICQLNFARRHLRLDAKQHLYRFHHPHVLLTPFRLVWPFSHHSFPPALSTS